MVLLQVRRLLALLKRQRIFVFLLTLPAQVVMSRIARNSQRATAFQSDWFWELGIEGRLEECLSLSLDGSAGAEALVANSNGHIATGHEVGRVGVGVSKDALSLLRDSGECPAL